MQRLPFKPNVEKQYFEKWSPNRDIANFIHPYRMLVTGLPNSGKTTTALSIIAQADPVFDEIILLHAAYFDTSLDPGDNNDGIEIPGEAVKVPEYSDVDFTCALKTIPSGYTYFKRFQNKEGSKKNLLIVDDCELKQWSQGKRDRQSALNKLFTYQSTHYGMSIIVLTQDGTTQLNPGIRRACNIFVIFRGRDRNAIQYMADNLGFPKAVLVKLFALCKSNHDNLTFDYSDQTPYPVRFNVINEVELVKGTPDPEPEMPADDE